VFFFNFFPDKLLESEPVFKIIMQLADTETRPSSHLQSMVETDQEMKSGFGCTASIVVDVSCSFYTSVHHPADKCLGINTLTQMLYCLSFLRPVLSR
jgi:hypothetical protein